MGGQIGYVVKFSCILELELSFDADELIQLSVEGTMATTAKKQRVCFPSGCYKLRASPLSDWQLNSCIR